MYFVYLFAATLIAAQCFAAPATEVPEQLKGVLAKSRVKQTDLIQEIKKDVVTLVNVISKTLQEQDHSTTELKEAFNNGKSKVYNFYKFLVDLELIRLHKVANLKDEFWALYEKLFARLQEVYVQFTKAGNKEEEDTNYFKGRYRKQEAAANELEAPVKNAMREKE